MAEPRKINTTRKTTAVPYAMFTAITAISAELWAVRKRVLIHETLLAKHGSITREMIETYMPTKEEEEQWRAERDTLANLVYDPFLRPQDTPHGASVTVRSLSD
jgi:hypothetical protein